MGFLHINASKCGDREGGRERKGQGERGKERDKEEKTYLKCLSHTHLGTVQLLELTFSRFLI